MGFAGSQCHAVWKLIYQIQSKWKYIMLDKLEMVELIFSKWPTLCCFCLGSPLDADFWFCSCCYLSRLFYGLILWVPELLADIKDIENSLATVMKWQSQVGQCWTPAGVLALGLGPSSSETVKDLSLGLGGLDLAPGSSACPGRVPGGQKPCDLPGWELFITLI